MSGHRPHLPGRDRPDHLLDIATGLAQSGEHSTDTAAHLVAHVSVAEVAASLGVSRTYLYKFWPTRQDFWTDLATFVLTDLYQPLHSLVGDPADLVGPDPRGALRQLLDAAQRTLAEGPGVRVRSAVLGYPASEALDDLRVALEHHELGRLAAWVDGALGALGRQVSAPFSALDLATAISSVSAALAIFEALDPTLGRSTAADQGGDGKGRSLLADTTMRLIDELSEPLADPDAGLAAMSARRPAPAGVAGPALTHHWSRAELELLGAARDLFVASLHGDHRPEHGHTLGHVSIARLARRARVSRQSIYNHWHTQDAFERAVLTHLLDVEVAVRRRGFNAVDQAIDARANALHLGTAMFGRVSAISDSPASITWAFLVRLHDPEVASLLRRHLHEGVGWTAHQIEALMERGDLAMAPPLTVEQLATALLALMEGSLRMLRANPGAVRDGIPHRGGTWSMPAVACDALCRSAMIPRSQLPQG